MTSTPDNITQLGEGEIFVFGSNSAGHHAGGAAKLAMDRFGARWGVGEGLVGQSYALPTLTKDLRKRSFHAMKYSASRFIREATNNPQKTFYLTKVGCGIAGYNEGDIAPLFADAPGNVIKPEGW